MMHAKFTPLKLITLFILGFGCFDAFSQTIDWKKKANPFSLTINSVSFRADGNKVLSGTNCHPASIRIYDIASGDLNWDYTVGSSYLCIMGVTFSSNTSYLAAIEEFGNIFIFDNTGSSPVIKDTISTGTSYGFSTAISPSNDKVAVGCSNGKMKIYNISNGTLDLNINAHQSWVTAVSYSPNGNYIVTGGNDDKVKIWDNAGKLLFTCSGHTGDITGVKTTPDNAWVISSSNDGTVKIWDIKTGAMQKTILAHSREVNGFDISPDGSKIVTASSDSSCKIWNIQNGNLLSKFGLRDSGAIRAVAWSPTGNKIVTGGIKSDLILWNLPDFIHTHSIKNQAHISAFPNPSHSFVNVELPTSGTTNFMVYNALGKLVQNIDEIHEPHVQIDISTYEPGWYYIVIKNGDVTTTTKFIKIP